jgi:hypothetical protein
MPRAIDATCVAGVVTAEGVTVPGTTILSEGVASSSGYLILDGSKKYYVAKTSPDLKASIVTVNSMVTKIANILTAIDTSLSSANAAAITALLLENTSYVATKDTLR